MKWKAVQLGVLFTTVIPVIFGMICYPLLNDQDNKEIIESSLGIIGYLIFALGIYIPLSIIKEKRILHLGLILLIHYSIIAYLWNFLRSEESGTLILQDIMTSPETLTELGIVPAIYFIRRGFETMKL